MRISDGWRSKSGAVLAGLLILGLLLPGLSGCGRGGRGRPRVNRAPGSAVTPDELTGRWKLQHVQIPVEVDFVLLDIGYEKDQYSIKLIAADKHPAKPKLKSYEVKNDGQVNLELETGAAVWSFQGRLDGESIWGTLLLPQFELSAAKLERSELEELDFKKEPERISALADLMAATNAADKFVSIDEFVKKKESYRSPLLIEAYGELAHYLKSENFPLEKVQEFVAEYRKAVEVWGPRMAPRVDLEVGRALTRQELFPDYAKELLSRAESKIDADYPLEWRIQLAENWVNAGDPERGLKLLKPLQDQDATNPLIRMVYAKAKEKLKDVDEALKAYAGLAMLPQLELTMASRGPNPNLVLPSESAARLWKEKHGDTKGLDAYLKEAYDDQMKMFVPQRTPTKRAANGKVILLELFTGAGCPPCVPADIACDSLHKAFSPQEVVVIKYHQHIPLPDPLTNEGGMERAQFYGADKAPTLMFNGNSVIGVSGFVGQAAGLISRLKGAIDIELKETSPVEVTVSAVRTDDDIEIKASVAGITTTDNDPRLILVLIENDIAYQAHNGIRIHNSVARGFAGGSLGTKLAVGKSDHVQKISLSKLRSDLAAHLKTAEEQVGQQFRVKPMALANLQVVAIIQKQITKTYVQAALTDVVTTKP